nr:reverse transcriptase domain-containing protein [Tanacetum cinerariifolium]
MQTRSSSRLVSNLSSNPTPSTPSTNPNPKGRNPRCSKQRIENFNLEELSPPIVTMADQSRIWLEKEPPRSIFTWDDLVLNFINQFFPPSKTTNLRNEITNFQQRFDESFSEAYDRFKDLLRACPHHGFSKLHQLDTFYNALNSKDQDSLNSIAGGNFLDKMPRECLAIIKSKSKVRYSCNKPVVAKVSMNPSTSGISPYVAELEDMVKALLLDKKGQNQSPAPVKAVEESYVTCGSAHSYFPNNQNVQRNNQNRFIPNQNQGNNFNQGLVYQPLVFQPPAYQAPAYQALAPQTQGVSKEDFSVYVKANDAVMRNMQTQGQNMQNQLTNLTDSITKFVNSNSASTSSTGTLPSNTITNLRSDLKAITTRSGVSYNGPQFPPPTSFLPKVVENKPEATKDTVNPTNNGSTEDVQPLVVQSKSPVLTSKPVTSPIFKPAIAPVSASKPNPKPSIPYPSRRNDERNREKANNQIEKFYQMFKDMSFKISFADALILMPKFASTLKALIGNKEKLSEMARTLLIEHCFVVLLKKLLEKLGDLCKFLIPCDFPVMAECLALADLGASINLMPFSVCKILSLPDLTPACMTLELVDHSISHPIGVAEDVYVKVCSFHFPADFVVVDFDVDPRVPLILGRSFLKTGRALIHVFEAENLRMELYMLNRQHGRMILESFKHGPLLWPTVEEDGVTRPKKYSELSATEAIQADCDVKATNIILQSLPPKIYALVSTHKVAKDLWELIQILMQGTSLTKQERECKLYDEFDKFAYRTGETLRDFYLRFSLLLNDMNLYNMKLEQFQVNTKFLNTLPPEWSKFVTDVKLVRDLHTTNVNQLHAYLGQHEYHANEVRLIHE